MGTQHIYLARPGIRRRRASFRRLFFWYCIGIIGATFVVTCILEACIVLFIALTSRGLLDFPHNLALQITLVLGALLLPFVVLIAAIFFFAWLMGHRIRQPVDELMLAVAKIRRQDLNFTINYRGNNELGDLCSAFNELRLELQRSLEREWRKQEEMRTTIAALSHDLRTPVTIIQGHIEGLARAESGEKRSQRLERYLPVLEASSQRMTRLLNDMLLVSALEQSGFVIQPQPVQLEQEMERKAGLYRLQAAAQEIGFSYTHQSTGSAGPVALDMHRIEQVLDNLFENALRYTPARGEISLTWNLQPGCLAFILRDSGPGIAPSDLPHVFEKFYQGKQQNGAKPHKASGLGLYTCKLLVERHGGTIAIQNHPAGGCEIAFSLPLQAMPMK